ncbi:extracellular solute-binding protein [Paenarthrobacter sp. CCNWLY172]|uniref:extracellular solute-binding protein n=1 Tax=unclassified Paenarthrobacter TaxID=2634190 RepID=UPI003077240D
MYEPRSLKSLLRPNQEQSPKQGLYAGSSGISRRAVLRTAAAASGIFAAGALTGCAGPSSGTPIQSWDLFSGADGVKMRAMIGAVSTAKGIDVRPVTLAWGSPYYTKLAMAASSGKAPNTAIMHLSRLAGFAPERLLQPYDLELLAEYGLKPADFAPAVWERCFYNGKLFAVPMDTHPFILLYNKDLAVKAGIADSDGKLREISSPQALMEAASRMAVATGKQGLSFGHVLDSAQSWRLFWGFYNQTGGGYTMTAGQPAQIDKAKATEVLTFLKELLDGKMAVNNQTYHGAIADFTTGATGMIFSGEWELPAFAKAVPNLGAVPMPTLFGTPASYTDSHVWVLPKQVHKDSEAYKASHQFVAGILKEGLNWAQAGHIPAFTPIQATDEYRALVPQVDYAAAGETPAFDPAVWFAGAGTDFQNQLSQTLSAALQGTVTVKDAVDSMMEHVQTMLSAPNPT